MARGIHEISRLSVEIWAQTVRLSLAFRGWRSHGNMFFLIYQEIEDVVFCIGGGMTPEETVTQKLKPL